MEKTASQPWFETLDDDVWGTSDEGGEQAAAFIQRVLHLRRGQTALDAPCGAGRVALSLARKGIRIVGIDLRKSFISRARARSRRDRLEAEFHVGDLRTMEFPPGLHGVFNWFNSFGYFSDEDNDQLVIRYAEALRPGGRLLIDQINRERILRNYCPEKETAGTLFRTRWDAQSERQHSCRTVNGVENPGSRSSQRWYTPSQMEHLVEKAGLKMEAIHGSIDGERYRRVSRHMIIVARKPDRRP